MSLEINNSFGFPCMATINEMRIISSEGENILLESEAFDNGLQLNYPNLMEEGQSKQTIIDLNRTNSNIVEILNAKPQKIIYNVSAIVNPEGNGNTSGFMTDESVIDFSIYTELPVYGTASGFEFEEPMETNLDDIENIESAELKVIIDNGIPIEAGIQIYFLDDQDNKIDSLYSNFEQIIGSANVDSNGNVTSANETTSYVNFTAERVEKIKQSSKMLMGVKMSTANNGNTPVRISTQHEMEVKIGMKIKVTD